MGEHVIVKILVGLLQKQGFLVATEVANFNRSADIAAIDPSGDVIVIECKMSNMRQAVDQLRTHKQAADRLYIATPTKKMRPATMNTIRDAGLGLYYIDADGDVSVVLDDQGFNEPWEPARDRLKHRILEAV